MWVSRGNLYTVRHSNAVHSLTQYVKNAVKIIIDTIASAVEWRSNPNCLSLQQETVKGGVINLIKTIIRNG
jgi:hypothetical protein